MKKGKGLMLVGVLCCLMLTACGNTAESDNQQSATTNQENVNTEAQNNNTAVTGTEAGTSDSEQTTDASEESGFPTAYYFTVDGLDIHMDDEMAPILEALGEPNFYYEAQSCAFEDMDRIYTYSGYEIFTYVIDGVERVNYMWFTDDSRKTREGAGLGTTLAELEAMYGTEYEQDNTKYSYSIDNCKLSFILENDAVISVEYNLIMEE